MFKILSLLTLVIQLLPTNGLTVIPRENTERFNRVIDENFAAIFEFKTTYENFGLSVEWEAKALEKFDYHVSIEKKDVNLMYCSGAILEEEGKQIIITAVRCVEDYSAKDLKIRYNTAEREVGGSTVDVAKVNLPYGSNPRDPRVRFAIIYPAQKIPVKSALSFPSAQNIYENDAVVTGWPAMYPVNEHTNLLLYTKQPILSESECGTDQGFLCAGVRSNKTSYCYLTTGSPLVATEKTTSKKVLLGFLMSDKGCRREITPTPYLDLSLLEGTKDIFFNE